MKRYFIQSGCLLAAVCCVYALIINQIKGDMEVPTSVIVSDEEFREIVIQHQVTKTPTPYPDFDLLHLSNVRVLKEENENDESRVTSTGEYSIDSTEIEGIESDNGSDSGISESEAVSCISDLGQDYSGESVSELVESGTNDFIVESGAEEYSAGDEGNAGDISPVQIEGTELTYLGDWTITAYCPCEICCGSYSSGYTASGTLATAGRTIACNSLSIGAQVMIDGNIYTVEDTGWSPYGESWIDIFFNSHDEALMFGMQTKEVYLVG